MILTRERAEVLGEKSIPLPLYPQQILYALSRNQTRDVRVTGEQLRVRIMARTLKTIMNLNFKETFSSYLTENTMCFNYKDQSFNAA
jgi:hypothetical protein